MRIDLHNGPNPLPEADSSRAQAGSARASLNRVEAAEDQAQFSGAHIQIAALAAQASHLPEIREERVQALRHAVQSGDYAANPENVAGAMLDQMISGAAA